MVNSALTPVRREVVITGLGVVSPIGNGRQGYAAGLAAQKSGVRRLQAFDSGNMPTAFGGEVADFDGKEHVKPRKSLKVMSRDIQFGFAVAEMALADANLPAPAVDPERFGVIFGSDMMHCELRELQPAYLSCLRDGKFHYPYWGERALGEMFPLLMLKYLPNMPACQVAIAHDARGPNNTIVLGEVSSLLAIAEAFRVIERGSADVMIAGGTSAKVNPMGLLSRGFAQLSRRNDDPERAVRPFDAQRDGMVYGEGAAALILESREHAERRGAPILARLLGYSSTFQPTVKGHMTSSTAISRAIANVLNQADAEAADVDHVNAHGMSTVDHDRLEAQAIQQTLGDVPVTAPKSYFGNLAAATGAVEMVASVLALAGDNVPVTLNYEQPDPACPVNVVRDEPRPRRRPLAVVLSQAATGQSAALLVGAA